MNMTIEFADRSVKRPMGVAEDVLVSIAEHLVPCDFVILDTNNESDISIILGRPFLATAKTKIDVAKATIRFKINGDKVIYSYLKSKNMIGDDEPT